MPMGSEDIKNLFNVLQVMDTSTFLPRFSKGHCPLVRYFINKLLDVIEVGASLTITILS